MSCLLGNQWFRKFLACHLQMIYLSNSQLYRIKEVVDSMMKAGEAQTRMKEIQVDLDSAMHNKQNVETEATMMKEKAESCKAEIKRLESLLSMITEEIDRLGNVVKELKDCKNLESGTALVSGTIVQELEASLAKKENYIRELETSLLEKNKTNSRQQNEIQLLNERLTNVKYFFKYIECFCLHLMLINFNFYEI